MVNAVGKIVLRSILYPYFRTVITVAICHGICTDFFLNDDDLPMGANGFCEIVWRLMDRVMERSQVTGRSKPQHLVLQADNTVAQAKNNGTGNFLAELAARGLVATATINFLMVGHTHEDVDQLFAALCHQTVLMRSAWEETIDDMKAVIAAGMTPAIDARGESCNVHRLKVIGEFDTRNRNHKSLAIANRNFEVTSFSRSEIAMKSQCYRCFRSRSDFFELQSEIAVKSQC